MRKPSNRDKILSAGLKVVHKLGFGGASVRDIIQAAGVPQGSFTNHFQSKEAFGIEILGLYFVHTRALLDRTLCNDMLPPLGRLRDFLAAYRCALDDDGMENGCLYGNFGGEAIDHSEPIRLRLQAIFADVRAALAYCLGAASDHGELPATIVADELAEFIFGGLQGATLLAKIERSAAPLERFERTLFAMTLGRPDVLRPQFAPKSIAA